MVKACVKINSSGPQVLAVAENEFFFPSRYKVAWRWSHGFSFTTVSRDQLWGAPNLLSNGFQGFA